MNGLREFFAGYAYGRNQLKSGRMMALLVSALQVLIR